MKTKPKPPGRVFVHAEPVNMAKSFDGLVELARGFMPKGAVEDHLFVFRNRAGDRLKLLFWNAEGAAIYYARSDTGGFAALRSEGDSFVLDLDGLAALIDGARCGTRRRAA